MDPRQKDNLPMRRVVYCRRRYLNCVVLIYAMIVVVGDVGCRRHHRRRRDVCALTIDVYRNHVIVFCPDDYFYLLCDCDVWIYAVTFLFRFCSFLLYPNRFVSHRKNSRRLQISDF